MKFLLQIWKCYNELDIDNDELSILQMLMIMIIDNAHIQIDFIHSEFYFIWFFFRSATKCQSELLLCVGRGTHVMYKVTYRNIHSTCRASALEGWKFFFFFFFHSNSFFCSCHSTLFFRFMCVMIPTMCILLCTLHVIRHSSTKPQQSVPPFHIAVRI